jgi:1-acyl-sn-glycerol-3-phosphate acyltransferase
MYLWLRPKVYRPFGTKSPKGAVLVSANHIGFLDPVISHVAFPWRRLNYLATKDLFCSKLKKVFFGKLIHCIMVDKENFSFSAFHEIIERLDEGKLIMIFPEGKINRDHSDTVLKFKSGVVLMAHKSGAPILPIYIVKREKWYHRQRIVIGEPYNVREELGKMPTIDQLAQASETVRQKEFQLREYFEGLPIYKKLHKNDKAEKHSEIEEEIKDEQCVQ